MLKKFEYFACGVRVPRRSSQDWTYAARQTTELRPPVLNLIVLSENRKGGFGMAVAICRSDRRLSSPGSSLFGSEDTENGTRVREGRNCTLLM